MRTESFSRSRLVRLAFTVGGTVLPDERMEVALRSCPFASGAFSAFSAALCFKGPRSINGRTNLGFGRIFKHLEGETEPRSLACYPTRRLREDRE